MRVEPENQGGTAAAVAGAVAHEAGSFGRAAAWLSKQVELALADVELSLPQYRVLGLLAEGASIPSALAERLTVRRPTVTAVVDGLEIRGLVQRTPGDLDKRSVTHTLTVQGPAPPGQGQRRRRRPPHRHRLVSRRSRPHPSGPRRPGAVARRHARLPRRPSEWPGDV